MGFRGDRLTLLCLLPHLLLNASSFQFKVPRAKGRCGVLIWQEYRDHNAVFVARAMTGLLAAWLEDYFGMGRLWMLRVGALYAQMFAADRVSRHHNLPSTTLGGAMDPRLRTFLATFQFFATSNLLFGHGFWQQFCVVFAIQVTAFTLTLNRCKLISPRMVVGFYTVLLLAVNQLVLAELWATHDFTVPRLFSSKLFLSSWCLYSTGNSEGKNNQQEFPNFSFCGSKGLFKDS